MFNFKIRGLWEAHGEIGNRWPTRIITLLGDQDAHFMPCLGDHHLVEVFDDVENRDIKDWTLPSREMVARILKWTADLTDADNLLVHCRAGKSRSTAMTMGILIQHGLTPQEAFDAVKEARPVMIPNRLMIEFVDDALSLDGDLCEVVKAYYEGLTLPSVTLDGRGGWNL